jgi:putative ABC transport system permease protein
LADDGSPGETRRVVGIVSDVRQSHVDDSQLDAYVPFLEGAGRFAFVFVRGVTPTVWDSNVRAAVAAVDPEVAIGSAESLQNGLDRERQRPRFLAMRLTVFAVIASGMALIGMYGVITYAVRQRQREIAIRMAVGATRGSVVALFLRQGALVLGGGLVIGLWGALGLGRVLESYLYGVTPAQPHLLIAVSLTFAVIGLVAIWWPARRAAMIDATIVLKQE